MDSYNLFGDDGSGMLEGLTDLGGGDGFTGNSSSGVGGDNKDTTDSGYRQQYNQGTVAQESSIQKLPSFGSSGGGGQAAAGAAAGAGGAEYHEYGAYPPRPRPPQPLHPSHHAHPSHSYPGYHPGPDPMYGMPEHPGIGDMWAGAPGPTRYSPMAPAYRHSYEHQQKMHQYPPQQGPGIGGIQSQNGAYLPRQPHFPQPPTQPVYGQQQNYPSYTQMHPPATSRINQHPSYHQQMDVNSHQYGMAHNQQSHSNMGQHQQHGTLGGHQAALAPGMQAHGLHLHHHARPPPAAAPSHAPYAAPHHALPSHYQPHQIQHLDVNVANQYSSPKPTGHETGSPQYRPPFHQISPQVSPRAQMSPRQPAPPQSSPRPVMSPVKGPSASPHAPHAPRPPPPHPPSSAPSATTNTSFASQNTLQALEQMVLPAGSEYPYQRNPSSPAMSHLGAVPQWNQNKVPTPISNVAQLDNSDIMGKKCESPILTTLSPDPTLIKPKSGTVSENMTLEKNLVENERPAPAAAAPPISQEGNGDTSRQYASLTDSGSNKESTNTPADVGMSTNQNTTSTLDYLESHTKSTVGENDKPDGDSIMNKLDSKTIDDTETSGESTASEQKPGTDQYPPENQVDVRNKEQILSPTNIPATLANVPPTNNSNINPQLSASQPINVPSPHNMPVSMPAPTDGGPQIMNRNSPYPSNPIPNMNQQLNSPSAPGSLPPNMPPSSQSLQTKFQNSHPRSPVPPQSLTTLQPAVPPNLALNNLNAPVQSLPHVGIQSTIPGHTPSPNVPCLPTMQQNIPNMPPNTSQNVPMGMPMGVPNMHPNLPPNMQGNQTNLMPNMPHNINPNMGMVMNPNIPHGAMPPMYSPLHHQERASLQQQIQEIYCLPPSPENQEKVRCLQERLALLQQHETNDKCNGGPNCMLQNPAYGAKMVESPQVTSTTGRGRGKGPARPRKPRAKKEKPTAIPAIAALDQLPVSEDCVTAGTGILNNSEMDVDPSEDLTNLDSSMLSLDESLSEKGKKRGPKKERKPRTPKEPKVPKELGDKPVKERKKREPKDPNAPKRKRNSKKDGEFQADTTTNYDIDKDTSSEMKPTETTMDSANNSQTHSDTNLDNTVTDFDDIPVSKIAIKDLLEEAEAKREMEDDDTDSLNQSYKKKATKKRGSAGGSARKAAANKKVVIGKRKRRGGIVPDSDGEPDDMMSTPPPSPPVEDDSLKRRSARNTQRKKYTDDVMIRLSDEEYSGISTPRRGDKDSKPEEMRKEVKDNVDGTPKPNYVYVNITDEDQMIVQHVLACRMGKREVKESSLNPPVAVKPEPDGEPDGEKELKPLEENEGDKSAVETEDSVQPTDPKIPTDPDIPTDTKIPTDPNIPTDADKTSAEIKDEPKPEKEEPTENTDTPAEVKVEETAAEASKVKYENEKTIIIDVEEFYVKYRNFSYLHCEWKTEEELYKGDKRIFSKIKRFKQKQAQQMNIFEMLDDEPFNPDYVEVERILDVSENLDSANNTVVKHYLVKWKSLQYEDSTWELEEDVDVEKIQQFKIFSEIPPKDKWKYKKRPSADNWVQLKESPLYKGGNTLRPYQLEGLNWLLFSWHNNRNCILADEMGLGKTIQSLTFVNSVWECDIRGPFLIIAPLSTIPNWQREFEGWTDMNVIVYHGSQQSKSMIQEYEFYFKNEKGEPIKDITKFNVLITTFEIIVTDFQELKLFNWRICVIDEAHRLKNRNCKLLEGLRQLHLEHRVLLSGTPLQNNVNELFSLLNFLEPSQFASNEAFLNEFGQLKCESEVLKLQALLKPMMLRRLKEDVEKTLAPKEETIIEVELTNIQKKYYRAILERNFSFLQKGTASAANIPNLMNTMMELRKCCIHPYLLNGAEDQIQFDYKQMYGEDKEAYYKALIQSAGKMVLVDKLLPKLKAGGHRVLIFSQMVRCLDILEDYLVFRKYPFERIDGRIRGNLRQEAIDRYSKPDSDRFVFLLCTKAGGLGINLTAADTVIIYDSDWNPQNDLQAQARCHRIGQQKMVKIYRLICRNTYEREMFDKASLKLGLDKAILQSMNTTQGGKEGQGLKQLSKKEIEDLLKKGAYGAVMDEDASDKFCEEDIEMILARRTQVIQMESEKGSTFSKASFAANDQRSDIDIRDPDFWNKWAKKAEIDTTEKKEVEDLIVSEPRKRTSIKRYGHDDGNVEMSDMEATPDSDEDEEGISLRSKRKKDKLGRKGRKYASDDYIPRHEGVPLDEEVVYGSWTRSECFKIERGLLTFGWARWDETIDKNQFRKGWTLPVIEDCARIIVLYCLRHYKGDEKIRNFIWDLIEPCENGEVTISRNHSGLHNPVPRGRNAKKKNRPKDVPKLSDIQKWEDPNHWSSAEKYDCEAYLESSYKKHLFRHANKVLLRVRMMYYIKHEVIGDYATQIESGTHARSEERLVRARGAGDEDCTDEVSSGAGATSPAASPHASPAASPRRDDDAASHQWPSMQDLNTRLRRLITAYQRNYKREELKMQQKAKMERRERLDQFARDEASQWRWSRADEEAFRRTVASYGVEFDPTTKSLRWGRFRALARLDCKSDDALTDYLKAFMAMCKRQCGLSVGEAELPTRADLKAEPIGEERAIATLERIDLLRVLREEVAAHAALEARLALCERSPDAPAWWAPQRHDMALVHAVCKHGLGDTYHKIFLDPKLPFVDCATKYYSLAKPSRKEEPAKSSDEDDEAKTESGNEDASYSPRKLRRSQRGAGGDDGDALSELESLARRPRVDQLSPAHWFTERALETRLHHIAHAVQNCEWPAPADAKPAAAASKPAKRHIAIDVETERAKLHALLSSPRAAHRDPKWERDDASSDSSRRSTPAPPPAHQRPSPAPPPPADAAPLDLSEAQDFSVRRPPSDTPPASAAAPPAKSRLDDTLSRLMKRKNVPAPEQVVGKEKKRKKLDEIVLGLSAAKTQTSPSSSLEPARSKPSPVLPNVSVTPVPNSGASSTQHSSQKPFSVTVTNVPSPQSTPKELSSFLQQSLEQTSAHKGQKASSAAPVKSLSHEAKVNKWLAEQAASETRRRAAAPRLAPDEHVPVVHRVTGKRLVGNKAPQLKYLAQWIAENPMYDIDPKWTEGIKEHVKLPQDVRSQRHSPMQSSSSTGERKKGRPPSLDAASTNVLSSNPHLSQNLAGLNPALLASLSAFDPKTLASTLSNLTGFDPKLLNTFDPKLLSSLSSFDPKNNPLLSSFNSMPNLLGGNLFANLAGLGLPGLSSLDMSSLAGASASMDSKSKSRKPSEGGSSSGSKASNSQFPFSVFPNPNMLYPQLGLGGLNPFGMHSGMSSAYDALGLLSSSLAATSATATMHASHASRGSGKTTSTPKSSTVVTSSTHSRQHNKPSTQQSGQMPQIFLPPDTYLLESLSKQSGLNYDALLKSEKHKRDHDGHEATDLSKVDKKKSHYDALRSHIMPPEFAAVQEKLLKGDKKDIDISKMLLEQMASGALSASLVSAAEGKKGKEDPKDVFEKLSKNSSEYIARALAAEDVAANLSMGHKRSHNEMANEPENLTLIQHENASKKIKESTASDLSTKSEMKASAPTHTGEMDLEDLIAPSTVIRTGMKPSEYDSSKISPPNSEKDLSKNVNPHEDAINLAGNDGHQSTAADPNNQVENENDVSDENAANDDANDDRRGGKKKGRKSSEDSSGGARRELRSNTGRQSTDTAPQ
ncbi:hypothetical protein JYU34_002634 [Plutella xylostella]|uniref:Chromodomain-helicase-DNA-binding protein 7 n=1 Tax=Plutella xylostella TaxID=51655 RepID=A0ABQ7R2Q8_PLUXY|nr:hypothetical protein JYU34_002634 [Plutella xylostella]